MSRDRLSPIEESFWRALMLIVLSLPRRMDADMTKSVGISVNEYLTLMVLSEAPGGELRMAGLARATALSASRVTRVVDALQMQELVTRRASAADRRGQVTSVTLLGRAKLESARAVQLSCVRALVFDPVDPDSMDEAANALREIADGLADGR